MKGFVFGGKTGRSYEDLRKSQEIAEAMVARAGAPRNIGEGLNSIGRALMARGLGKQADEKRSKLDAEWSETVSGLGLDPQRAAIFGRLEPGQRDSAMLRVLDQRDAEARARARSGASAAKAAAKEQEAARQRQAVVEALMPQTQQRAGVALGPTNEAAQAGAQSGGDLGMLQTETVQRNPHELMSAMLAGGVDPSKAMSVAGAYQDLMPQQPKLPSSVQEFEYGRENPEFNDWMMAGKKAGATNITNTVGGAETPIPGYPKAPNGFMYVRDPGTGQVLLNEQGIATMSPIVGGPEDTTKQDAIAQGNQARSGDVVIEDIDRVLGMMNDGGLPTTGGVGNVIKHVPGTDSHDTSKLLETIKANVGFDRLQQMRDASKTGGALGAINQTEMGLLTSALGSLEQSQSKQQFEDNLVRLRAIYSDIVHGPQAGSASNGVPDFSAMTDEQLDAWIAENG